MTTKIRSTVKWNTGTRVHKPAKGKGSYKRKEKNEVRERVRTN